MKTFVRQLIFDYWLFLTYAAGGLLISLWTLLTFLSNRTIFDLVGQQVWAQQLLVGQGKYVGIGVTNYIIKTFILYIPLDKLPGAPRLKLLLLTLLLNLITFLLLAIVSRKLLQLFGVQRRLALCLSLLWLAAISGSVFWMQFTNSRNLEVAGGLWLLYLCLRYLQRPNWSFSLGLAAYASVLFFCDSLQLYMIAVPLLLYAGILMLRHRQAWRPLVQLALIIAAAAGVSRILFSLSAHLLSIHYITAGHSELTLQTLKHGATQLPAAFAHLFAGGANAGKLRELLNAVWGAVALVLVVVAVVQRRISRRLVLLVGVIILTDAAVYIVSGQANVPLTQRYLIMTVPVLGLLFGAVPLRRPRLVMIASAVMLLGNGVALVNAVRQQLPDHFNQDTHLASVQRAMSKQPDLRWYASADTALPLAYLDGDYRRAPLPLVCTDGQLRKDDTFYARQAFSQLAREPKTQIAIVLDGRAITNTPAQCTLRDILAQVGQPTAMQSTDDGSVVLLYSNLVVRQLGY